MNDALFRKLNPAEEGRFRQWARNNWEPETPPSESWHPVVRDEWRRLDAQRAEQDHASRVERDRRLYAAFSAGNYAAAYETTDYAEASQGLHETDEYETAFLLGFFASYEHDEVPAGHLEAYEEAMSSPVAARLTDLGVLDRCWLVTPGSRAEVAQ